MTPHEIAKRALAAWDSYGQFTMPEVAPEDPNGRAMLYIAGYLTGCVTSDAPCNKPCCTSPYNPVVVPWTASDRGQE